MYVESARMAEMLESAARNEVTEISQLVRRAQRGDAIAFGSLVNTRARPMCR